MKNKFRNNTLTAFRKRFSKWDFSARKKICHRLSVCGKSSKFTSSNCTTWRKKRTRSSLKTWVCSTRTSSRWSRRKWATLRNIDCLDLSFKLRFRNCQTSTLGSASTSICWSSRSVNWKLTRTAHIRATPTPRASGGAWLSNKMCLKAVPTRRDSNPNCYLMIILMSGVRWLFPSTVPAAMNFLVKLATSNLIKYSTTHLVN
jgi:hypothetical protein